MQHQLFKRIVFTFSLILMVVILTSVFGRSATLASASFDTDHYVKHYESIEVKTGESLWSIAENYAPEFGCSTKEYIKEIREINGLQTDYIRSGAKLIVVYYEEI